MDAPSCAAAARAGTRHPALTAVMTRHSLRALALSSLLAVTGAGAQAADFSFATAAAALPTTDGTGLDGSFYSLSRWPNTLADAATLIADMGAPTVSFTATGICMPTCSAQSWDATTSTDAYLATSATGISGSAATLNNSAMVISGYLAIRTAGDYTFSLGSDDGSSLSIAGMTVINNDGNHGLSFRTTTIHFAEAGLYAINVNYFEDAGWAALTLLQNGSRLATTDLYAMAAAVPEPATTAMWLVGLAAIGATRITRRRG